MVAPQAGDAASNMVLVSGGYDFTVRLWNVPTGACVKVCQHADSHVLGLAITPDRRTVAAAGYQGIRLFDTVGPSQTPTVRFDRLSKNVTCVGFHRSGQWMYSGGEDGFARIFDLRARATASHGGHCCLKVDRPVTAMALHPTKPEMFIGVQTGAIHVMDLRTLWNEEWSTEGSEMAILSLAPHPNGQLLAAATSTGVVQLYTVGDARPQSESDPQENTGSVSQLSGRPFAVPAHTRHVLRCAFSPDGRFLATTSADKTAKIWRVWITKGSSANNEGVNIGASIVCELPHPAPKMWIWDCAWSADSQHIFTACADNVVRLWSLPPEALAGTPTNSSVISSSPPSPNSGPPLSPTTVAAGSTVDNSVPTWPRANLDIEYAGHQKPVVALAYADR